MLRILALGAVLSVAGASYASFELALLLQDVLGPSNVQELSITRWDPVSRAYLGRFAVFASSNATLALDPGSPGNVNLVSRASSSTIEIRRYDYSTGLVNGLTNIAISSDSVVESRILANGNLLLTGRFSGAYGVRQYTTGGVLVRNYSSLPSGTDLVLDSVQAASGITYILSRQPGSLSGNKFTVSSYAAGSSTLANSTVVVDNLASGSYHSLNLWSNLLSVGTTSFSNREWSTVTGTTVGAFTSTGGWIKDTSTLAPGHFDTLHGFAYDSAGTQMVFTSGRITSSLGNTFYERAGDTYRTVYDSAIVLAPEPGTLLALGAGVGVLLRRRKKKA